MANHSHSNGHSAAHANGHASAHEHHIIPLATYVKVYLALVFLTVITVSASRIDFGTMNAIVAFGIATVKALLVASIFMHLKYDDKLNRWIIVSAVFFLGVLWFFSILDEVTRITQHSTL
jgi:cytochrome c oxidase subunit 4